MLRDYQRFANIVNMVKKRKGLKEAACNALWQASCSYAVDILIEGFSRVKKVL